MTKIQKEIIEIIKSLFENDMKFGQIVSNVFLDGDPYYISDENSLNRLKELNKIFEKQNAKTES